VGGGGPVTSPSPAGAAAPARVLFLFAHHPVGSHGEKKKNTDGFFFFWGGGGGRLSCYPREVKWLPTEASTFSRGRTDKGTLKCTGCLFVLQMLN